MELNTFLQKLKNTPDSIAFSDTMAVIEALYEFKPTAFKNGELMNEQGQNSGSCKLFAFAQLQGLSPQQTLACFGAYYRDDVLKHPDASDHQNIRNFMKTAWSGIHFNGHPLTHKHTA
jgi:HopJ type III effector protein